jgi:hypothetical protein
MAATRRVAFQRVVRGVIAPSYGSCRRRAASSLFLASDSLECNADVTGKVEPL